MKFLTAIIDALAGFVQRNPLTVLIIVFLPLVAPALLKGIAAFILYFLLGIVVFALIAGLWLHWRIEKARRRMMEERFDEQFRGGTFRSESSYGRETHREGPFGRSSRSSREGEVKIYVTSEAPEKRVAHGVGDYVDFEETKTDDKKR